MFAILPVPQNMGSVMHDVRSNVRKEPLAQLLHVVKPRQLRQLVKHFEHCRLFKKKPCSHLVQLGKVVEHATQPKPPSPVQLRHFKLSRKREAAQLVHGKAIRIGYNRLHN